MAEGQLEVAGALKLPRPQQVRQGLLCRSLDGLWGRIELLCKGVGPSEIEDATSDIVLRGCADELRHN